MFFTSIIFLTILIPSIQTTKPTLKIVFHPEEQYYEMGSQVEISCEILDTSDPTSDIPQLWLVDFKTNKRTSISRSLLFTPPEDAPDVFKNNKHQRIQFVKKNSIRIRQLLLEDSNRYECDCPDCEQPPTPATKDLQVMKVVEPVWHVETGWPIQEDAKLLVKCTADEFYPYVSYNIIRHHHDISREGKADPPENTIYPQKFSWEATLKPTAEWHNTTLQCTIVQGKHQKHATKVLEVTFVPRFIKCSDKQHVDSTKETSTIECSFSGNPAPQIKWFRQNDDKPLVSDANMKIDLKDDSHGKYTSIITFERDKLMAIPTTTRAPNAQGETTPQPKIVGDNYYQQLLNSGFVAKLYIGDEEKGSQKITIVSDINQAKANPVDNSSIRPIRNLSTSMIIFSLLIILYMFHHH